MKDIKYFFICFSSGQLLSRVWLFATPWIAARQASLFMTTPGACSNSCHESVMPSNHLIHPLLFLSPPAFNLSQQRGLFQWVIWPCIRWPRYWNFTFSISTFSEYSGLISFRVDWFDLLAVQGTLKGLLQHRSSKASILRRLAFFIVQLSHPYMTTGKTIALTKTLLAK